MSRPTKKQTNERNKLVAMCRQEYVHGFLINDELVYPSIEVLIKRHEYKVSRNILQKTARDEAWNEKRKRFKIQTAVILPDEEETTDVKEMVDNLCRTLVSECMQVEKARIDNKQRRTPKELVDLSKFIKTVNDVHSGVTEGAVDIKVDIKAMFNQWDHLYPENPKIPEATLEILEVKKEEDEDIAVQVKLLEESEGV